MSAGQGEEKPESGDTDVRTMRAVEYGIRDWGGELVTMPDWQSPADVVEALHRLGYPAVQRENVLTRTTTTTVTTTGWEAAS